MLPKMKASFHTSIIKKVRRRLKGPKTTTLRIVTAGIKDDTKKRMLCPMF